MATEKEKTNAVQIPCCRYCGKQVKIFYGLWVNENQVGNIFQVGITTRKKSEFHASYKLSGRSGYHVTYDFFRSKKRAGACFIYLPGEDWDGYLKQLRPRMPIFHGGITESIELLWADEKGENRRPIKQSDISMAYNCENHGEVMENEIGWRELVIKPLTRRKRLELFLALSAIVIIFCSLYIFARILFAIFIVALFFLTIPIYGIMRFLNRHIFHFGWEPVEEWQQHWTEKQSLKQTLPGEDRPVQGGIQLSNSAKDPHKLREEGNSLYDAKKYKEAAEKFQQSAKLYEKEGNMLDVISMLLRAGECSYKLTDYEIAIEHFNMAAEIAFKRGLDRLGISALEYILDCYVAQKRNESKEAIEIKRKIKEIKDKLQ